MYEKTYKCPRCGSVMEPSKTLSGAYSKFWVECPKCNAYHNTFKPQPHQQLFHADSHRFKGNFGGFGSGKTSTSLQEIYKHIFLIRGRILAFLSYYDFYGSAGETESISQTVFNITSIREVEQLLRITEDDECWRICRNLRHIVNLKTFSFIRGRLNSCHRIVQEVV